MAGVQQLLLCLADIHVLMNRAKELGIAGFPEKRVQLLDGIKCVYDTSVDILRDFRDQYKLSADVLGPNPANGSLPAGSMLVYAHHQRLYGLALFVASYICGLLKELGTGDQRSYPKTAAGEMASEIVQLAREASRFRPLGSGYMLLCLGNAWLLASGSNVTASVESLWATYSTDFPGISNIEAALEEYPSAYGSWKLYQGNPVHDSPVELPS